MFENLIEILKANPRKIVYTEGSDARILESAARLKKDGFLTPILVGNVDEVKAAAAKGADTATPSSGLLSRSAASQRSSYPRRSPQSSTGQRRARFLLPSGS